MQPEELDETEARRVGLCFSCRHARTLPHPRGGPPYWQCEYAQVDPRFPRYPRLPVMVCPAYAAEPPPP